MMYGPTAALIAESFPPRLRYIGASLGYQLASVIAGGPAPLVATALFAPYHSGYAITLYILACAVISLAAATLLKDYTKKDISEEHDTQLEASAFQAAGERVGEIWYARCVRGHRAKTLGRSWRSVTQKCGAF